MKRKDRHRAYPSPEDTFVVIVDKKNNNIAKVTFTERNGSHHNSPGESFDWVIEKKDEEDFTPQNIGFFLEEIFREKLCSQVKVKHIVKNNFRVIKVT